MQERIIKQQFEGSLDSASDSFIDTQIPSKKLTLAEILAKKREQLATKNNPVKSMIAMMEEVEAEIVAEGAESEEVESEAEEYVEEEFLEDHESLEAIQAEAGIAEIDMEPDSLLFSQDISDNDAYTNIDVDSLEDGEQNA
jgi:hypothetical protein